MKRIFGTVDRTLLLPIFVLQFLSLTTLFSIDASLFRSQLLFFVFSLFVCLVISQIDFAQLEFFTLPFYLLSIVLLLFVFAIGISSHGAVRWLDIFGFRIQFSEILKPFLITSLSFFLLGKKKSMTTILKVFILLAPIFMIIFFQPDLGNALLYLLVIVAGLLTLNFPFRFFLLGTAIFASLFPFLWHFLHTYQKQRLLTFIHPANDPLGNSYNAAQSLIAVGSGGFFGKGFGETTQSGLRFLPERHTDFIFATISEALGLFGALIVLLSISFLLYRIYLLFMKLPMSSAKIFVIFAFFLLLLQSFINMAMNMGTMPIVGIALPFVSYGGSSLLSNFILIGLLLSLSRGVGENSVLEIR